MSNDTARKINQLSRSRIQDILESYGFAVYDSESTDQLCEALRLEIEEGVIPRSVLDD